MEFIRKMERNCMVNTGKMDGLTSPLSSSPEDIFIEEKNSESVLSVLGSELPRNFNLSVSTRNNST
jgi:hypothetical protein